MLMNDASLGLAGVAGILYDFGIGNGKKGIGLTGYLTGKCICKAAVLSLSFVDAKYRYSTTDLVCLCLRRVHL